jgi:hypothetical protein
MACGCSNTSAADLRPTRAAMCQACPFAERLPSGSAITCTISGRSILAAVHVEDACPMGRHPDRDGRVRWAGADWLGVPEPIRWRLVWDLGREPQGLVGCGCLAAVKASWAGPWLEPWLEGVQALRTRLAGFMGDWRAAMAADATLTPH